jgi:hypothetical protein
VSTRDLMPADELEYFNSQPEPSEALAADPGSRAQAEGERPEHHTNRLRLITNQASEYWSADAAARAAIPIVEPGQLWLIELPAADSDLSPLERQALSTANVVIYDSPLAAILASILPLGGYAEPAASGDGKADHPVERCLRLALDGWSVVRLVEQTRSNQQRTERIRLLSERLLAAKAPTRVPALLFTNADGGICGKTEAQLGVLAAAVSAGRFADRLTIIFAAISTGAVPGFRLASSNGLAG